MKKTTAKILWVSDNYDPVIYNLLRKSLPDIEVYVVSPDSGYLNYIKEKNIFKGKNGVPFFLLGSESATSIETNYENIKYCFTEHCFTHKLLSNKYQ